MIVFFWLWIYQVVLFEGLPNGATDMQGQQKLISQQEPEVRPLFGGRWPRDTATDNYYLEDGECYGSIDGSSSDFQVGFGLIRGLLVLLDAYIGH